MDSSPIFWDTQGEIKYNIDRDYFKYETSMNINWNNKLARKVLINLFEIFNIPDILYLKPNGIAIWTPDRLKNMVFYKRPVLFNEINIRDMYVLNNNKEFVKDYPFLNINYKYKIDKNLKNKMNELGDYFVCDSFSNLINIKSRTLEENMIMLDILINDNVSNKKDFLNKKKNKMAEMDKTPIIFEKEMRLLISKLNNKLNIFINDNKDETNIIET
tara:strand:- start:1941 stop:2588 length:648 start_codon:yes stop_codon:yes gene_type:complete